ncbi:hypothetical protein FIBSPDRAFT_799456 [Athelia psychrophila]|uniref:ER membrane protein complex subunit 7 beta-sandwich domain-containing protein n=1 Tax=Athelia psychrophila TaxID=1759441 RepID=A0A166AWL8_9AGAM|nr:hypothetical protein FIBSPDRAFT_799456 [Fibularhizoctonia sp. CBS 109695]
MFGSRLLLVLSSVCSLALALDIRGSILWNDVCPSFSNLSSVRVVLNDGKLSSGVTREGGFLIPDVPSGSYLLSALSHDYTFDSLRIDVPSDSESPSVHPHILGTPFSPASSIALAYPVVLTPRGKNAYYVAREGFNVMAMLSNPMMLIMGFTAIMMFAMPYIMKNLDPQMLEEMNNSQKKMMGVQSAMQSGDIKSGLAALVGAEDEPKSAGARNQPASSQVKNRGGKNKKR